MILESIEKLFLMMFGRTTYGALIDFCVAMPITIALILFIDRLMMIVDARSWRFLQGGVENNCYGCVFGVNFDFLVDMYYINKLALFIANPVTCGCFIFLVALCWRKYARWFTIAAVSWFLVWSMGAAQNLMAWVFDLKRYPPMTIEDTPMADVIVDLGGGVAIDQDVFPYVEIQGPSDRVAHCARLWKAGKAPIIVPTGGKMDQTDAVLLQEFGVSRDAIVCENQARNTEENAIFTAKLLAERAARKSSPANGHTAVLLVTSSSHMRRAMMIFKKCAPNLNCIPVPCDFGEVCYGKPMTYKAFIPSAGALVKNMVVYKECLGILGYTFRGF